MSAPAPDASESRRTRVAVRQSWADRLERFAAAGLSPAEFCAAEGVSVASFYAWKRRLAAEQRPAAAVGEAVLLPVRLTPGPAPVEIALPGGAVLRLSPGCDLGLVRSLLAALGAAPC